MATMLAKKDKLRVIIHTKDHIISGEVYLYENSRLSDILNAESDKLYLPMTKVVMKNIHTETKSKKDFILINKHSIDMLYLDEVSRNASENYTMQAESAFNKKSYDFAISEARKAISIDETNAKAHYLLGMALGKKQELSQALKEFEFAYKHAEKNSNISMMAMDMINQIRI